MGNHESRVKNLLMKASVLLLLTQAVASGKIPRPDFSIDLNFDHDTTAGSIGALAPRVRWNSDETSVAGWFDVQGGIDSTLTNIRKPPETYVWGEAKRKISSNRFSLAIRGDTIANECEVVDLDVRVNGNRQIVGLRLLGSADLRSRSVAFDTMLASTNIDAPFGVPGKLVVNPRYDLRRRLLDATAGYSYKNTVLGMDAKKRQFTISHAFGRRNRNRIVPTFSTKTGCYDLAYIRNLAGSGSIATTWKPNDSIAIRWLDRNWEAAIRAPTDGFFRIDGSGVRFSMKRNVGVSLY